MFSTLFPLLYIQISPDTITIRDVHKNITIQESAELALLASTIEQRVIGVGNNAQAAAANRPPATIVRPFDHPRTLIADFRVAEAFLKHLVFRTLDSFRLRLPFKVVLHLVADPEAGFAKIEIMAFRQLLFATGCRKFVIWQGSVLSDQDLISGTFPSDGQILDKVGIK